MKETLAVETRSQPLAAVKFHLEPANGSPDFMLVLRNMREVRSFVVMVVANKRYDTGCNHEYIRENLG